MRRVLGITVGTLALFCLLFVGGTPKDARAAAPTKTTAFDTIDAWQSLAAATLAVGNSEDVSASYSTVVYVEVALTGAAAQDGVTVIVEIAPLPGDDWVELAAFTGTAETPGVDDLNEAGGTSAGDTTITLTDATTDEFDVIGRRWFIVDTTVAESEVVRTKSIAGNVVTLCQDAKYAHADAEVVTDRVDQWPVRLPFPASYVRVLVNNTDADAAVHWRSHCSKVTAAPG